MTAASALAIKTEHCSLRQALYLTRKNHSWREKLRMLILHGAAIIPQSVGRMRWMQLWNFWIKIKKIVTIINWWTQEIHVRDILVRISYDRHNTEVLVASHRFTKITMVWYAACDYGSLGELRFRRQF